MVGLLARVAELVVCDVDRECAQGDPEARHAMPPVVGEQGVVTPLAGLLPVEAHGAALNVSCCYY